MNQRTSMPTGCRRGPRVCAALGAVVLLSACGNVTSGGVGEVEVLMSSDEVAEMQQSAAAMLLAEAEGTSHASSIEGTLTVRVRSHAQLGTGEFVELTDGVQELTLSLDDPQPVVVARRSMPAGSYDAVRTSFERIEADVTEGLVIDELEIIGVVRVDLGPDGTFSTSTSAGFEVVEDATTVVAIDMRSPVWLQFVDHVLNRVDLEDFRQALRVRIGG